jgi:hypothetical protein
MEEQMSGRQDPWKKNDVTVSKYRTDILRPYEKLAKEHMLHRNDCVSRVLVHMLIMRLRNIIPAGTVTVDVKKAWFQTDLGDRPSARATAPEIERGMNQLAFDQLQQRLFRDKFTTTQDAHQIPGQVYLGSQQLDAVLADKLTNPGQSDAHRSLTGIFGGTTTLPRYLNEADSLAESSGLVDAFRNGCRVLLQAPLVANQVTVNHAALVRAYQTYLFAADEALRTAIETTERLQNAAQRENDKQKEVYQMGKRWILEVYLNSLDEEEPDAITSPSILQIWYDNYDDESWKP